MHDDADRRHGALKDKEHAREELGSLLRDLTGQLRDAGELWWPCRSASGSRARTSCLCRARSPYGGRASAGLVQACGPLPSTFADLATVTPDQRRHYWSGWWLRQRAHAAESDVRAAEEALARAREHHHGVLTRERDTR